MPNGARPQSIPRSLVAVFMLAILSIGSGGYVYYHNQQIQFKERINNELIAIADLKARQISTWRKERIGDGRLILNTPALSSLIQKYLLAPDNPNLRQDLLVWMAALQEISGYSSASLLDAHGAVRLSSKQGDSRAAFERLFKQAVQFKKVFLTDFHRMRDGKRIHLDLVAPIVVSENGKTRLIAVLCLGIDPQRFLYPLIQTWPTPSRTAETLLVEQQGDAVVFLNELRHKKNTALLLRMPLTDKELPAARGVQVEKGVVEGIDYRSLPVLAAFQSIPDTPWSLVAKVDREEIYAPLRTRARIVTLFVVVIIIAVGFGVGYWWRQQSAFYFRQQYEAELRFSAERKKASEALEASESRYRRLFETAQDGILILDADTGNIVDINPYLADLLGYSREYFLGKELWQIGLFKDIAASKAAFQELQQTGYLRYEHLPLETKDGQRKHVEVISNDYLVNGRKVIQCNIRDITARKQAEDEKDKLFSELKDALDKVKTLSGMLPICSHCKKIRNDQGYWSRIEEYITEHSEAIFSHGICPECAQKLYPEYFKPELHNEDEKK